MSTLSGITIAADRLEDMARFYERVLGVSISRQVWSGLTIFAGTVSGIEIRLFPKQAVGITARQNLHQLRFRVSDVDAALAEAEQAGGTREGNPASSGTYRFACVRDPDGNTVELYGTG